MKIDLILGSYIFIGVEGKNIKDIKDKIAYNEGLSNYGKSLLVVMENNKR